MYEIDKSKFGAFIFELRKEKGFTQKELAEKLFISDKAVSKWETGHSVPDITLLVPLSEILEVTVTELLECRRIEKEVNVAQMDDVVKRVIHLSEEEKYNRPQVERKDIVFFIVCVVISLLELFGLYQLEHAFYFVIPVFIGSLLAMLFGIYFWFFIKEKLPVYYDENKINVYVDGMIHMNMPGVTFNNNNWPHIVRVLRIWSIVGMTIFPVVFIAVSSLFSNYRPMSDVVLELAFLIGGLFIPVYVLGKKYQYAEGEEREKSSFTMKKKLFTIVVIVGTGLLLIKGMGSGNIEMAFRVGNIEHSTRTSWSAKYMFCDGYMQRIMWLPDEAEKLNVVVETEEGTIDVIIEDAKGNVIFEKENVGSESFEIEVSRQYQIRLEMEEHKGSFYIGD